VARPTKSRSLYCQMIGRSTRPLPDLVDRIATPDERRQVIAASPKPFCRILDFVGNSGRHKLVTCADVLGGKMPSEVIERANEMAQADDKPRRMLVTLNNAQLELERKQREEAEKKRRDEEAKRAALMAKVNYHVEEVNPFGERTVLTGPASSRDGHYFSEKQAAILRKNGYDPTTLRYGAGKAIIGKIMQTVSPGQRKVLIRFGFDPSKMDRKTASKTIDVLARNNWRTTHAEHR